MIKIVKSLKSIISLFSDPNSIKRPPFDSSYQGDSNDMCFISVALILTELFCLEYLNLYDQLSHDLVIGFR